VREGNCTVVILSNDYFVANNAFNWRVTFVINLAFSYLLAEFGIVYVCRNLPFFLALTCVASRVRSKRIVIFASNLFRAVFHDIIKRD